MKLETGLGENTAYDKGTENDKKVCNEQRMIEEETGGGQIMNGTEMTGKIRGQQKNKSKGIDVI